MFSSHADTLAVFMLCSRMVFLFQSIVGLFFCNQSCPIIMSLPSLITIAQICVSRPLMVIVPLAWRVASWLQVPSPNVIGMFLSIVVTWRLFCCVHISLVNFVSASVSISASPTARLPHGSFQIAGRVISLPWPGLPLFPGLVCFPILGLQGYSLPLRSGNCDKYVRLSHTESISCLPSFYPSFVSYLVPWGLSCVPMLPAWWMPSRASLRLPSTCPFLLLVSRASY